MSLKGLRTGERFSLAQLQARAENSDLSPKAQQHLEQLVASYTHNIQGKKTQRYRTDVERIEAMLKAAWDEMDLLETAAAQIAAGMADGSISVKDGRRDLTRVYRDADKAEQAIAQLENVEAEAWALVEQDPAEYQESQLTRFPALRNALPEFKPEHFDPTAEAPSPFAD